MGPQCLERRVDSSLIPGFLARVPRRVVVLANRGQFQGERSLGLTSGNP